MGASRRGAVIAVLAILVAAVLLLILRAPGMPLGGPPVVTTTVVTTEVAGIPATVTETEGFTAREGVAPSATVVNDEPPGDLNSIWTTGDIPEGDAQLVRDEFIRGFGHDGRTERRINVYLPSTGGAETFSCARDVDVVRCDGPGMQVFIA
ncbi:hypothetical protein [Corynebacterium guangdongense]|uniref:Serine/threonine protein kinase n=1 Tax=Corynebacterium guangdongense TaxID=1783348 RepID=A0ABU1ZU29_9CORY|nr:hypothetical protein [Corynebacterium guangdongense]MDR7328439.1 hypothetical protein [Corynebacterium guangdongense]WJZ17016.1 hypothetical protein CGUA_02080 [Corynebacterium guangdongense]